MAARCGRTTSPRLSDSPRSCRRAVRAAPTASRRSWPQARRQALHPEPGEGGGAPARAARAPARPVQPRPGRGREALDHRPLLRQSLVERETAADPLVVGVRLVGDELAGRRVADAADPRRELPLLRPRGGAGRRARARAVDRDDARRERPQPRDDLGRLAQPRPAGEAPRVEDRDVEALARAADVDAGPHEATSCRRARPGRRRERGPARAPRRRRRSRSRPCAGSGRGRSGSGAACRGRGRRWRGRAS